MKSARQANRSRSTRAAVAGTHLGRYLVDARRATFECRREMGICILNNDGPWHHEHTEVGLEEIQRAQVADLGRSDRPERTVELSRDAGILRFGPTELCGVSANCPESKRVSQQIQTFVVQRTQPTLYVSYGPFRTLVPPIIFSLPPWLCGCGDR